MMQNDALESMITKVPFPYLTTITTFAHLMAAHVHQPTSQGQTSTARLALLQRSENVFCDAASW